MHTELQEFRRLSLRVLDSTTRLTYPASASHDAPGLVSAFRWRTPSWWRFFSRPVRGGSLSPCRSIRLSLALRRALGTAWDSFRQSPGSSPSAILTLCDSRTNPSATQGGALNLELCLCAPVALAKAKRLSRLRFSFDCTSGLVECSERTFWAAPIGIR